MNQLIAAGRRVARFSAVGGILLLVVSCTSSSVVAEQIILNGDTLTVCDLAKLEDKAELPLSDLLAEELQIVRLEDKQEAYFKDFRTLISDNYIGVIGYEPTSFKLFDKTGKYLNDIGTLGNGPNEYRNIYWAQMDEKTGCIYILPWQSKQILVFGMDGSFQPSIPLVYPASKGCFVVNSDSTVSVAILPFQREGGYIWTQDMQGNLIHEIGAAPFQIRPDFSNEIFVGNNMGRFDPFLVQASIAKSDTLCYYDAASNRRVPVFTVLEMDKKKPIFCSYGELPGYYWGQFSEGVTPVSENSYEATMPKSFFVKKEDLSGGYFKNLTVDMLGNTRVWPGCLRDGYFIWNTPAITLKKILQEAIDSDATLDPRFKALKDSLRDEDNNVVLFAKLKTD